MIEDGSGRNRGRLGFGKLLEDLLVLSTGQLTARLLGFVAFAILARRLSTADYGIIETAVSMAAVGVAAVELGTGPVGVRRLASGSQDARSATGSVISARLVMTATVAPALLAIYALLTAADRGAVAAYALFAAGLFAAPFNHSWFFQERARAGAAAAGQTIRMATFLLVLALCVPAGGEVWRVGLAEAIAATAMGLFYSLALRKELSGARPNYDWRAGLALLKESAPLGAASFASAASQYLPVLIVAGVAGATEAAELGAAQRIGAALVAFSFTYQFNLYPLYARRLASDRDGLQKLLDASSRFMSWISVGLVLALALGACPIMTLLFGSKFETAGAAFSVLSIGIGATFLSGNARWMLIAAERTKSLLVAQIAGAATAICVSAALSAAFGSTGAAAGAAAAALVVWAFAHNRTRGLPARPAMKHIVGPGTVAIVIAAATHAWVAPPLAEAIVAAVVYAVAALLDPAFRKALISLSYARIGR